MKDNKKGYYKKSLSIYSRFLRFLIPYWKIGAVLGILMIFSALLQLPAPLLTRHLIDVIVPAKDLTALNLFVLLLIGVVVSSNITGYVMSRLQIGYRNKIEVDIRSLLFEKILRTPLSFFERNKVGYLESRISSDVNAVSTLFMETLLNLLVNGLTFMVGVGICFYLHMELAIISLMSLPIFIISFHVFSKKMNQLTMERQEQWAMFRGDTTEFLSQAKIIKSFNKVKRIFQIYMKSLAVAIASKKKQEIYNVISSIAVGLTATILPLFVLWYAVKEIIEGQFTVGGFIAFNTCIGYLYDPVSSIVSLNINIHSALAAAERIFQIIDSPEEADAFAAENLETIREIRLDNVSFYYSGKEKRGITNVSYVANKQKLSAVVGETGKGKSTIARLLLGFDVPQEGELLIDGRDYKNYSLHSIRERIAYVPQEPELLSGTIFDNITFFSKNCDEALLKDVVRYCMLEDTLKRFKSGLDTDVFESGTGLSGGEKQRIAIARALMTRPDFLLLDEATSAIDPQTEAVLTENITTLPWKPGIIMITHKHHFLDKCDSILKIA